MKKTLSWLLALVLVCTALPLGGLAEDARGQVTLEQLQALNGGKAAIHTENGKVTFVGGTCTDKKITGASDALAVVDSMRTLLGGDEKTRFDEWNELRDPSGNVYYVFQQTYASLVVLGGAAKVICDRNGTMLGLTGSVVSDLPEAEEKAGVTEAQAEEIALRHELETRQVRAEVLKGMTRRVVLPVNRELDMEADELQSRFVYVVYTNNPSASVSASSDLPYLAHYVTLDGEYLYSLPTILPGDAAGNAGYDAEYAFQFMEPAPYTGYVDWSDGTEHEITIDLMRDTRTGMYYLGNIEHKIVVADCWEFLYNGGRVKMEYSPDNLEWDQVGLQSLYNYCRACDYYKEIGWQGADGKGTPIIVLKDFCDDQHRPIDNAAFAGQFYGWQCFLSSSVNDFAQCLDVCAHEFTHCVTHSVMTYNSYMNDYGAINEAMSDIQGNLCEMYFGDTSDTAWLIAENASSAIRSMSDPHRYQQPAYSWDLYYMARVKTPTPVNDQGGVHTNSSLLNNLAYRLCANGGMTLEEARAYWFAVDCAMVPGTDYLQLRTLLPWTLSITGLEKYQGALSDAIAATRLGDDALPEELSADQAMLLVNLPDNEVFNNGNWMLTVFSFNLDLLGESFRLVREALSSGEWSALPEPARELLEQMKAESGPTPAPKAEKGFLATLLDLLSGEETDPTPEPTLSPALEKKLQSFSEWLRSFIRRILFMSNGNAGADGHTIRLMSQPGRTIPLLQYLRLRPNSDQIEAMKILVFLNGHWVDLDIANLINLAEREGGPEETKNLDMDPTDSPLFRELTAAFEKGGLSGLPDAFTLNVPGGQTTVIPSDGLENIDLTGSEVTMEGETPEVNNRKSRPKLPDAEPEQTTAPEAGPEQAVTPAPEAEPARTAAPAPEEKTGPMETPAPEANP